jgi:hypothetical protein
MPLPITLTVAYLAINLAVMVWLESERAHDREPSDRVTVIAGALRYAPPLAGLVYLVTIAGDWLFFGFVLAFFAGAFWLMDGLLAFTGPSSGREAMRSGWDDRRVGDPSNAERDRS